MFIIYINDLPATLNKTATSVIFADDTSIIITNSNKTDFENALQQ
jgi:MinD-like ATPase involved in chromosome partitioning or flagellar assembly